MKNIKLLFLLLILSSCSDAGLQTKLTELENELSETKTKLTETMAANGKTPGLIHNVFFWLKPDLSEADKASFLEGVKSLSTVPTVRKFYLGPPASTEARDVVDNTFSYALLVHFDDVAGQDAYQVDPIHLKFVEDHKDKWTAVKVYDNMVIE